MSSPLISALAVICVAPWLGCTTVYQPPPAPLTAASLDAAIRTLEESEADVEMLEDGLLLVAFLYEMREPLDPIVFYGDRYSSLGGVAPPSQPVRMLVGPGRELYLPYARIENVSARSWPLWAGVEIEVVPATDLAIEGPLVIEAADIEEAQRLTDAIDTIRRVRLLSAAIDPKAAAPPD